MPRHDLQITLRQMLTFAREAMEMVSQATRATLEEEIITQRALAHA